MQPVGRRDAGVGGSPLVVLQAGGSSPSKRLLSLPACQPGFAAAIYVGPVLHTAAAPMAARPPTRPPARPPTHPPTHLATIWGDAGDHVGCAPANCGALVVVRPQGNALCREGHAAQGQVTRQDEKTVRRTGLAGQGTAPALGRALHSLLPAASQISPQPTTPAATLPSPSPNAAVLIPTHRCVPDPPGC